MNTVLPYYTQHPPINPTLTLSRWIEALNDESTGLTIGIVRGTRKQSVPDCEAMYSPGVIQYMEKHGHVSEAKYAQLL